MVMAQAPKPFRYGSFLLLVVLLGGITLSCLPEEGGHHHPFSHDTRPGRSVEQCDVPAALTTPVAPATCIPGSHTPLPLSLLAMGEGMGRIDSAILALPAGHPSLPEVAPKLYKLHAVYRI